MSDSRTTTRMNVELRREDHRSLSAYAAIPIDFEVREVLDVAALASGDATVPARPLAVSYRKDYDAYPDGGPLSWATRFDVRQWIVLAAYVDARRIGGVVIVVDPSDVVRLGGRAGFAILWDLRIASAWRRRGVGRTLVAAAEAQARAAGSEGVDVETQDVNVPACRLYAHCGYTWSTAIPGAYRDLPDEVKLVWTKRLS